MVNVNKYEGKVDDSELFDKWFNGEDIGVEVPPVPNTEFMPLEKLLESINLDKKDVKGNIDFIKRIIHLLSENNPYLNEYVIFLKRTDPQNVARYLAPALGNNLIKETVKEIFFEYGASHTTVGPLTGALGDTKSAEAATEVFMYYGSSKITAGPLVRGLEDPQRRNVVIEILKKYGPTKITVESLVGGLNGAGRVYAKEILIDYGRDVLRYIRPTKPGNKLHETLTEIVEKIREDYFS